MIACFDVYYSHNSANGAAVIFADWKDSSAIESHRVEVSDIGEYKPGAFYKRELKPLVQIIEQLPVSIQFFVIDAYCHLSADGDPGLGAYLHKLLPEGSIVIGVAKNRFRGSTHAIEVLRGDSKRPLFVTSIGIDYRTAADYISMMAGKHRMPKLLKLVDQLSRVSK